MYIYQIKMGQKQKPQKLVGHHWHKYLQAKLKIEMFYFIKKCPAKLLFLVLKKYVTKYIVCMQHDARLVAQSAQCNDLLLTRYSGNLQYCTILHNECKLDCLFCTI